jgi:hypothetical protein
MNLNAAASIVLRWAALCLLISLLSGHSMLINDYAIAATPCFSSSSFSNIVSSIHLVAFAHNEST